MAADFSAANEILQSDFYFLLVFVRKIPQYTDFSVAGFWVRAMLNKPLREPEIHRLIAFLYYRMKKLCPNR
jgi:hypothetical protein